MFFLRLKRSESVANRQYVLMYPSYQFVSTRQDQAPSNPFQTFLGFIGFGQAGQNTQMMDAVEMNKPEAQQAQAQSQAAQNSIDDVSEKSANKPKLYYTFATPASTVPLNAADQRFYFVEQPQLFGAVSGSNVNPVFNLQPVPVVLSRSNVAQPDADVLAQPSKVNSENVQKFSQIPPPAVGVEPVLSQVQGKSSVGEVHVDQVPSTVVQHDSVVSVKHVPNVDHVVEPVAESRVNPAPPAVALEDNRAVPVPVDPSVQVKSAAVVETRSNPVPLVVSSESVVAPIVSPPAEVKDAVQSVPEVASTLKELQPVQHDAVVAPVVPAVIDQHVGDKVEQDVVKHV